MITLVFNVSPFPAVSRQTLGRPKLTSAHARVCDIMVANIVNTPETSDVFCSAFEGVGHTEALRRAAPSCCCVAPLGQHGAVGATQQQPPYNTPFGGGGNATARRNSMMLVAASLGVCSQPESLGWLQTCQTRTRW